MHPFPLGSDVLVQESYVARIVDIGTTPQDHPCVRYRGLPGYRVRWYALDEKTGATTTQLEPLETTGSSGWVVQEHCRLK